MREEEEFEFRLRLEKEKEQKPGPQYGFKEGMSDVVRGAAAVPASIGDLPYNAINLGKMAYGAGAMAFGRPDLAPEVQAPPVGQAVQRGLTSAGLPDTSQDYGAWGNIISRATQASAAILSGAGMMKSAPASVTQVASPAATQAVAGETASQMFPGNQTAEIFSQMIPGVTRVPTGNQAQINARDIRQAGGNPTVNQTRGGYGPGFIEGALGRLPGGDYATYQNAQKTNVGMGNRVSGLASDVSPASSPMQAGRSIQKGIDKFVVSFRNKWNELDVKVAQHFTKDDPVQLSNTMTELQRMGGQVAGAENAMGAVGSKGLQKLMEGLSKDSPDGNMRYEAFRKLRSAIGEKTASANLTDDISTGQYKALYGAMSKDLEAVAVAKGPAALKAYQNQNNVYKAGIKRIDDTLQPLANKATPEAAYQSAIAGSDKGATTLWSLRRSLPTAEWKDFVGTFVDRMGKAKPGQQSAEGDTWSAQRFLTDWNTISPQAKNALFASPQTPDLKRNLNQLARASELVIKSGKMYSNPSGSAPLAANLVAGGSIGTLFATGQFKSAAGVVAGAGLNYAGQRMMQTPAVVDWMAKTTRVGMERLPSMISRLTLIAERSNDDQLKQEVQTYVKGLADAVR